MSILHKPIFRGVATAIITPFIKDGGIDFDALGRLIDFQIASGINAIVVCGTTGEASTMSTEEKDAAITFTVKRVNRRIPVIAGTGGNDTAKAIEATKRAAALGADAALVVTPYYNKTSQNGLVAHYNAIADSSDIPIILYNVPSRTGLNIEPSTYAKLAVHPNIAAIKEANGNISKIVETVHAAPSLTMYCGNDDQIVPMLSMGAQGVISVVSNVLPTQVLEITQAWFAGNTLHAATLQAELVPAIKALFSDVNPIPVKEAAAYLGYGDPTPRLPLIRMEAEKREGMIEILKGYGV